MRFLLDQNVYASSSALLQHLGHEVLSAEDAGLATADDEVILHSAQSESRIVVTRDRDFGKLCFYDGLGSGVIFLRILPSNLESVHQELQQVLRRYSEELLLSAFVVIDGHGHRIRKF